MYRTTPQIERAKANPGTDARTNLYKKLYLAARGCVSPEDMDDSEEIKRKRDEIVFSMYGGLYTECTDEELGKAILEMQLQSGYTNPGQISSTAKMPPSHVQADCDPPKITCSKNQLAILRAYAIPCALTWCRLDKFEHCDNDTGEVYDGDSLRKWALEQFNSKKMIPPNIYRFLHENWINPKSHQFLIEGRYKGYTKNPKNLHYDYLKPQEAQYLIIKYRAMWMEHTKGSPAFSKFNEN